MRVGSAKAGLRGDPADQVAKVGAFERAASFVRGWWGEPPGPPFAPRGLTASARWLSGGR